MLNNARTLAFCVTRSLLPRTVTSLVSPDHLVLTVRRPAKQTTCRYLSSSQNESVDSIDVDCDDFEGESPYTIVDFAAIAGEDPEKIKELKKIQLEIDIMRQQGERVPSTVTKEQWKEILELRSSHARTQRYNFLWMNECKKLRKKERQIQLREEFLARRAAEPPEQYKITTQGPILYSLSYNTLFWRIGETYMRQLYNLRLLYASMFGPHIIVDCGYEPFMTPTNLKLCVKQILLMWSDNRNHWNPFHLLFCNLNDSGELYHKLRRSLNSVDDPEFPFFSTPEHYLDLYPREKLVYLTPHCTEELESYNSDHIYIIGGYVDKNRCEHLSLAKAKKEGVRMAKFPLDKYLKWQVGVKSLTLNHCLAIMNDLKDTNDWNIALRHIPPRKTKSRSLEYEDEELEKLANIRSAKVIREHYRRNLVYDMLMKESDKK